MLFAEDKTVNILNLQAKIRLLVFNIELTLLWLFLFVPTAHEMSIKFAWIILLSAYFQLGKL